MTTFKDAIQKKNVDYNNGYVCNMCNMTKYSKPFVIYKENDNNENDNICGYSCCKKMYEIDKEFWSKIINKIDFDLKLVPIIPKHKKTFEFLTKKELLELDEKRLIEYYYDLNDYYNNNPERASMQMEIMEEYDITDSESDLSVTDSDSEYWSE
jgi:hypothetical protein|tara:strand:- start:444 stop:905 length:462 start_codon:yes stop_codon:yes gene_type:complete